MKKIFRILLVLVWVVVFLYLLVLGFTYYQYNISHEFDHKVPVESSSLVE